MLKPKRQPTHPGIILLEHYLKPRKVSITAFAEVLGCSRKHISNLIHEKVRIEAYLATRIAAVLGTTAQFWLNLQNNLDIYLAEQQNRRWKPAATFFLENQHL